MSAGVWLWLLAVVAVAILRTLARCLLRQLESAAGMLVRLGLGPKLSSLQLTAALGGDLNQRIGTGPRVKTPP